MPEIDILIRAVDQASAPAKNVDTALKNMGNTAKDTSTKMSGMSTVASGVGNVLKAGLTTAIIGVGAALGGMAVFLKSSVDEARTSIEAHKQLEQVIKSTGGAAGVTAQQADDLATSLAHVTNFQDDAVLSGENLLLTFTNIGKDVFPTATQAMLDMSQALGQDMKSSAVQLGKALNDPINGISALSRVGVSFTDQQKEMIKTMVEAGNTAGAQKVILAELAKEFGGSAQALADPATQLQNAWKELEQGVGTLVIPILNSLARTVLPYLQQATEVVSGVVKDFNQRIADGEAPLVALKKAIYDALPPDLKAKWDTLSGDIQGAINTIVGNVQTGMGWVKLAWDTNWEGIHKTWTDFATKLPTEQAAFWVEWHKAFDTGTTQNANDWGGFFAAIFGFVTRGFSTAFDILTGFLHNWNNTTAAFHALAIGDWSTFFSKIGNNFTTAFGLLLSFADVFDSGLKSRLLGNLNEITKQLEGWWQGIAAWWNSTVGALFGTTVGTPSINLGILNTANQSLPTQLPSHNTSNGAATTSALGGVTITQHFYGQTDPATVHDAASTGVLTAARSMGLR